MIFLYPFMFMLDLLFTLTACVLFNWWVPAFSSAEGNLPSWLKWFQTFDATLDEGWKNGYFPVTGIPTGLALFKLRVRWLYRNPGYGFSYYALGVTFEPGSWRVRVYRTNGVSSLFFATCGLKFNFEYGGPLGEYKLGWKAWNYYDTTAKVFKSTPWGPEMRAPLCGTINPLKRTG